MGSKYSSEKKEENAKINDNQSLINSIVDSTTSYEGIVSQRSCGDSNKEKDSKPLHEILTPKREESKTNQTSQSPMSPYPKKVLTPFKWKEGGSTVYVTGSFSNWNQWFIMNKSETIPNEFYISLELPIDVYQYKFIVDSVWKFAKDQTQINDGLGNINNTIDNSIFYKSQEKVNKKFLNFYLSL